MSNLDTLFLPRPVVNRLFDHRLLRQVAPSRPPSHSKRRSTTMARSYQEVCTLLLLCMTIAQEQHGAFAAQQPARRLLQTCGSRSLSSTTPQIANASIGQSTPLASVTNSISVSLIFNVELEANSTITITGLMPSQTADSSNLVVSSSQYDFTAVWVQSTGTATMTLRSACVPGNTLIEIDFSLRNPAAAQSAPSVSVSAQAVQGNLSTTVSQVAMDAANLNALGVTSGGNPLLIVIPTFSEADASQSNPFVNEINIITFSLTPSATIASSSTVNFNGLSGLSPTQFDGTTSWGPCTTTSPPTTTASSGTTASGASTSMATPEPCAYQAVTVTSSTQGISVQSAFWNAKDSELVLNVGADLQAGSVHEFQIESKNPPGEQSPPSMSVSGSVEAGTFDSPIPTVVVSSATSDLEGIAQGSAALLIANRPVGAVPNATTTTFPQSTPTEGCAAPKFGDGCTLTCSGVLDGGICQCQSGQFGFDCSQSAQVDTANSVSPTLVVAGTAASVVSPAGIGVSIPAGAFTSNQSVSISVYQVVPTLSPEQATLTPVGPVCDFQPEGVTFAQKVDLTLTVDSAKQAAEAAKGNAFEAHFLDKTTQLWVSTGGVLDAAAGTLTTQTDHFSMWTVMSVPAPTATPEEDPDDDGDGGLSTTAIIAIAASAGGVVLLCCIAALVMRCRKPKAAGDPAASDAAPEAATTRDAPDLEKGPAATAASAEAEPAGEDEKNREMPTAPGGEAAEKDDEEAQEKTGGGAEEDTEGQQKKALEEYIEGLGGDSEDEEEEEESEEEEGSATAEVGFLETVTGGVVHFFESIRDAVIPPSSDGTASTAARGGVEGAEDKEVAAAGGKETDATLRASHPEPQIREALLEDNGLTTDAAEAALLDGPVAPDVGGLHAAATVPDLPSVQEAAPGLGLGGSMPSMPDGLPDGAGDLAKVGVPDIGGELPDVPGVEAELGGAGAAALELETSTGVPGVGVDVPELASATVPAGEGVDGAAAAAKEAAAAAAAHDYHGQHGDVHANVAVGKFRI